MAKIRFIAGAVCPQCNDQDSLRLVVEADDERVECVSCEYTARRPEAEQQAEAGDTTLIGLFKP